MQSDHDRAGDDADWGTLAEKFFERGESLERGEDAGALGSPVFTDEEPDGHHARTVLRTTAVWLAATFAAARPWLMLRLRLAQLRSSLVILGCTEHALRVVSVRALRPRTWHPFLAVRHPRLALASRVILFGAAMNYSIAAALAAVLGA